MLFVNLLKIIVVVCVLSAYAENVTVRFDPSSLNIQVQEKSNVSVLFRPPVQSPTDLVFTYSHDENTMNFVQRRTVIHPLANLALSVNTSCAVVEVEGLQPGNVIVGLNSTSTQLENLEHVLLRISVLHSHSLSIINIIIGWIYFAAWSISFYPQIIENWQRKSVVGLNFDFLYYNITGHFSYCMFNIGLFWIPVVQEQYFIEHPLGINPVLLNDVCFSINAVICCAITIFQSFIYESGGQRLSLLCRILLGIMWLFLLISLFLAVGHVITWLMFLYFFSYVKLFITFIKYFPQALMNWRRKSTVGWSIGNILLDFTGGMLSILQMLLIAYNADDWGSCIGNPVKFGLGLFSIVFDVVFIIQHYCLYRGHRSYEKINGIGD